MSHSQRPPGPPSTVNASLAPILEGVRREWHALQESMASTGRAIEELDRAGDAPATRPRAATDVPRSAQDCDELRRTFQRLHSRAEDRRHEVEKLEDIVLRGSTGVVRLRDVDDNKVDDDEACVLVVLE